jgi:hypothetical protein
MTLLSSCTKLGDFGIKVARIKKSRFIRSWGKYLNAYLKANNLSEQPGSNLFRSARGLSGKLGSFETGSLAKYLRSELR